MPRLFPAVTTRCALFLALFSVAAPGLAFTAEEHRWLSRLAHGLAFDTRCGSADEAESEANSWCAFLQASLESQESPVAMITVAVDWTRSPEDLVPGALDQDKEDVEAIELLLQSIHKVKRNPWSWLAKHRNSHHFQDGAARAFSRWHGEAIAAAAAGNPREAIAREAVALHFLQDFLAAGHFITTRSGLGDAPAGGMHDRFNWTGLDAQVRFAELWTETDLRRALGSLADRTEEAPCPQSSAGWSVESVVQEALEPSPEPVPARFFGDHRLCRPESRRQALALLLVSARSILEVAAAARDAHPGEGLSLCFHPLSATAVDEEEEWRRQQVPCRKCCGSGPGEKDRGPVCRLLCPDEICERFYSGEERLSEKRFRLCSMAAPWAAVKAAETGTPSQPCWLTDDRPLIDWKTKDERKECESQSDQRNSKTIRDCTIEDLCETEVDGIALSVAVAPLVLSDQSTEGFRLELGIVDALSAWSRVRRRGKEGEWLEDPEYFTGGTTGLMTYGLRYEDWAEFQSLGFGYRVWSTWPLKGELDFLAGGSAGWDYLENDANGTTRFQYGLFGGLGVGPALGELGVEYGYDLLSSGRAERTLKYYLGFRFEIASTWFRRLLHH